MSKTNYSSPICDKSSNFRSMLSLSSVKKRAELSPEELYHENAGLRLQLRELNLKLNEILDNKPAYKKKRDKMGSPKNILVIARKQLQIYESEYESLAKRIKIVSDPGYILQLQQKIEKLSEEIEKINVKNHEIKVREKKINWKLDNPKKQSLATSSDLHVLLDKKTQLEEMVEKKERKLKEIESKVKNLKNKSKDIEEEINEYSKKGVIVSDNSVLVRYKSLESVLMKSQRGLNQLQRSYKIKLDNLTNQLKKIQSAHSSLSQKFESSFKTLKKMQGAHSALRKKFDNSYNSPRNEYLLLRSLKSI